MQIVIELPEIIAMDIAEGFPKAYIEVMADAIRKGRVLPKHGRLIDADKLEPRDISPEAWYSPMWGFELVDIEDAPTIMEADTESEGGGCR